MKIKKIAVALGAAFSIMAFAANPANVSASERTKIVFWHEMTGPAQVELKRLVNEFNKHQDKYEVEAEFEGDYNEAVQKILNTHGTDASPAVFQAMDISSAQMYYGKQLSMPFNSSQPVLYYNKTLLKKLGITPPPLDPSYSDVTRVANAIYKKSNHKIKGMSIEIYGWFFEQFLANAGVCMANKDDGHNGVPTAVDFTSGTAVNTMKWIQNGLKQGSFMNYGAGSNAGTNETAAFLSRRLGMFLQSSGSITQLTTGTKDEIGVCYYPHEDGKKANGVSIGGASLWISNDKSKDVQRGAWELVKYLLTPESQASWQAQTGYLALNKKSADQDVLKKLYKKMPQAKIPSQQLNRTMPNKANSGIFMQNLVQNRLLIQTAMEQIYDGKDARTALTEAQTSMNKYVASNNKANGFDK